MNGSLEIARARLGACLAAWAIAACFLPAASGRAAEGWPEVFDPFRVLTINLQLDSNEWDAVRFDRTLTITKPALMWADGETNALLVEIKRKSDPALPSETDPRKVSLKLDLNAFVPGQKWRELTKLSLENGNGGNSVVQEGFAWAMHRLASEAGFYRYPAGCAAWVRLVVNGSYAGVYTSAEERGKQFLDNRGMYINSTTWLYKYDPNPTLEAGVTSGPSPALQHLCYLPFAKTCPRPDLEVDLPLWIDMQGMLTLAAIEAFTGNNDGLFTHNGKNTFAADYGPTNLLPRLYFPWDLDSGLSGSGTFNIYTGGPSGGSSSYQTNILAHYWFRQVYRHTMADLLSGPLSASSLTGFLARAEAALTPALDSDPYSSLGGATAAEHFESIRQWVAARTANVRTQLGALTAPPSFSCACGEIAPGFPLALGHTNATGTIRYTLDGTDPRAAGGSPAGAAYAGPLTLTNTTHVMMRVLAGTNWSALRQHTFNVAGHAAALKVTELMYHPRPPTTNDSPDDYEFLELKNTGAAPVNLSGCRFEGITFAFKPGTTVTPGAFVVLVRNPVAFSARYPGVPFLGVYWGGLDAGGERIRLMNSAGSEILDVTYDDDPPWPQGPDGLGWSLVNLNPAGDPDDPANWRASAAINGSPGADDPAPPYGLGVVVNEVLTHTDPPQVDAIELHNPTDSPIDIGGWYLSDQLDPLDPAGAALRKYRIPDGIVLPAGGFEVFYEGDFNPPVTNDAARVPFALSSYGEEVWLSSADATGNLSGLVTGFRFGAADNGVSIGRHPISTGWDVAFLDQPTFGTTNGPSLEKVHPAAYGNDPASWRAASGAGTPGRLGVFTQGVAIATGGVWRYDANGCDLGAPWRAWSYADSGWLDGHGVLGYGAPFIATALTNGEGQTSRAVTVRFRKDFALHGTPASLALRVRYDDGFVAWLNGTEVVRRGLPAGAVSNDTLATEHDGSAAEVIDLTAWSGLLTSGKNTLAVELHQAASNDPDAVWDAELTYVPAPGASPDLDGDGMPDAWEFLHGLDWADAGDAMLDADGDGFRNRDECLAGTNPRDASSLLKLVVIRMANQAVQLEFLAVSGKTYRIEHTPGLPAGAWTSVAEDVSATGPLQSIADTNAPAHPLNAYRVRLAP